MTRERVPAPVTLSFCLIQPLSTGRPLTGNRRQRKKKKKIHGKREKH